MFKKKEVPEKKSNIGSIIGIAALITGMAALILSIRDILKRIDNIGLDEEELDNIFDDEDDERWDASCNREEYIDNIDATINTYINDFLKNNIFEKYIILLLDLNLILCFLK